MDILKKVIHDYNLRKATQDSAGLPTPRTLREPSATERNRVYTPVNYGLLFCPHGKSYFDVCSNCRRSRKAARLQYETFCHKHGIE
jgi:hypothetical protein